MTQPVPEPLRSMLDMPDRDYRLANVLGAGANTSTYPPSPIVRQLILSALYALVIGGIGAGLAWYFGWL